MTEAVEGFLVLPRGGFIVWTVTPGSKKVFRIIRLRLLLSLGFIAHPFSLHEADVKLCK